VDHPQGRRKADLGNADVERAAPLVAVVDGYRVLMVPDGKGNNYFTEMGSGSEAGSYVRRIDLCSTQL